MNYSGAEWLNLWQTTGLSCLFHVRSCSGNSHPAEDVISPETSSLWDVSVGDLHINFILVGNMLSSLEEGLHGEENLLFRY